jgi:hypothetical protein
MHENPARVTEREGMGALFVTGSINYEDLCQLYLVISHQIAPVSPLGFAWSSHTPCKLFSIHFHDNPF